LHHSSHATKKKGAWKRWFWFCFYGISAGIGTYASLASKVCKR
jgi:hypothetical protein